MCAFAFGFNINNSVSKITAGTSTETSPDGKVVTIPRLLQR
ncbi:hypothetical protein PTD2_21122 [Pseudoalteromonas tunicata D2]|uniref:Uncharacterized protein n=1 Tax=Pseudoalteromonas tunicata D2 TaxID=87626 RepID=A4CAF0_9GAMM|nr:hypothetical protein PTD2_21122 [Pseudoalteromonas tunicata D2]